MLAVNAAALGVSTSLEHVVNSVSGVERKPTPVLLLPVDSRVATAMQPDIEDSWLSSTSTRKRRGSRHSGAATPFADDALYRFKRERNNEAARRSREKRRQQDGVLRQQLDALAAENRELRCQLALFRRLLDEIAAGKLVSSYHKDGVLQPGWSLSSISSSAALSTASDQSARDEVMDELSIDDVNSVGAEVKLQNGEQVEHVKRTDDDFQHQLTPLNLSQRATSS